MKGRDVSFTATPAVLALQFGRSLPLPLDLRESSLRSNAPASSPAAGHIRNGGFGAKTCASSGTRRQPGSLQPRHANNVQGAREPRAGACGGPRRARQGRARSQEGKLPALRQPEAPDDFVVQYGSARSAHCFDGGILRRGGLLFEPGSRRGQSHRFAAAVCLHGFRRRPPLDGRCHVRPGFGDALFWVFGGE